MSKKVIFGGSFNPVTLGHGTVISRLEEAGFQEIILLPCFDHFHGKELELSKIRLEMCRRMFRNRKGVRVSNFEIKNQLTGATIDLIQAWLDHYGEVEDVFFLIGTDNDIIAGHGRVMAAKKLGISKVPCIRLGHLTDAQKKAYIIADNKLALNAGWDEELLAIELTELNEGEFDLGLTGFSEEEIAELLNQEEVEGLTDEDEAPEPEENPVTVEGDVWLLGRHRLMCGDSTSIDSVEKLMNGSCLLYTSPSPRD